MPSLPARFCELCGCIHEPPIHDFAHCSPGKGTGRVFFSPIDTDAPWPTKDEMEAAVAYWDAVLSDKGTKPLS